MDCYHIYDRGNERSICNLGIGILVHAYEHIITLQDAATEEGFITEDEKCEICWRDDEWMLLLLAEVP